MLRRGLPVSVVDDTSHVLRLRVVVPSAQQSDVEEGDREEKVLGAEAGARSLTLLMTGVEPEEQEIDEKEEALVAASGQTGHRHCVGSVTVKTVPSPTELEKEILPFIKSTNFLVIARPRPVLLPVVPTTWR